MDKAASEFVFNPAEINELGLEERKEFYSARAHGYLFDKPTRRLLAKVKKELRKKMEE